MQGKRQANKAHYEVGEKVRATIKELGGTMPEALPSPTQSVKHIESAKKKLTGKKSNARRDMSIESTQRHNVSIKQKNINMKFVRESNDFSHYA